MACPGLESSQRLVSSNAPASKSHSAEFSWEPWRCKRSLGESRGACFLLLHKSCESVIALVPQVSCLRMGSLFF